MALFPHKTVLQVFCLVFALKDLCSPCSLLIHDWGQRSLFHVAFSGRHRKECQTHNFHA